YPWITGVLPGVNPQEEVLVLGHTSEQGAQDNATGVAAMVEALHTISRMIDTGKLPRPARSIRILLMPEVYGSLSYISENRERMNRTVAAMTVDTPAAAYEMAGTEYTFYMNPHVAMSYTDALIQRIAKTYYPPSRPWHWQEYVTGTDTYLSEPTVGGVPTVWPYSGTGVLTHHNSEDKPETVDLQSLHDLTALVASYLYFNATAGEPQVQWLSEITLDHTLQEMQSTAAAALDAVSSGNAAAGSYGIERIRYLGDRGSEAAHTALRVVPSSRKEEAARSLAPVLSQIRDFQNLHIARLQAAGAKDTPAARSPEAEEIIVRRIRPGSLPMDDLPQDQWHGYPSGAWDKQVTMALYWCDGKRNLADVIHLTKMETGPTNFDFIGYFRFLRDHGYVEFAK
ncbi:MAG: M28 family peptidase, partial [Bryobacteraceae bacterium]